MHKWVLTEANNLRMKNIKNLMLTEKTWFQLTFLHFNLGKIFFKRLYPQLGVMGFQIMHFILSLCDILSPIKMMKSIALELNMSTLNIHLCHSLAYLNIFLPGRFLGFIHSLLEFGYVDFSHMSLLFAMSVRQVVLKHTSLPHDV